MTVNPQLLDVLLKPDETLNDEDKTLIRENRDVLNDEEKEKWSSWLEAPAETKEDVVVPPVVEPVVEPIKEEKSYITQDQLDSYLEKKRTEWTKDGVSKEEQRVEEKKILKFFGDNEKPADWNDAGNKFLEKLTSDDGADVFTDRLAPLLRKKIQDLDKKDRAEYEAKLQELNAGFDKEHETLADAGKLPHLNTKEGKEVSQQLAEVGAKYGLKTVTQAYDVWSKIPVELGGGYKMTPASTEPTPEDLKAKADAEKKQKLQSQKDAASKVGASSGTEKVTTKKNYDKIHGRTYDQMIEDAFK